MKLEEVVEILQLMGPVVFFNLLPSFLISSCRISSLISLLSMIWKWTIKLWVQSFCDILDPGAGEAMHYPGIICMSTEASIPRSIHLLPRLQPQLLSLSVLTTPRAANLCWVTGSKAIFIPTIIQTWGNASEVRCNATLPQQPACLLSSASFCPSLFWPQLVNLQCDCI